MFKISSKYPAVTFGVSPKDYHALGAKVSRGDAAKIMSRSELMDFAASPRKYLRTTHSQDENSATKWGNLIDCLLLTRDKFETDYAICPETYPASGPKKGDPDVQKPWNWNANFCKDWRTEQHQAGLQVIESGYVSEAWVAVKRFEKEEPEICELLAGSKTQVQIMCDWHDESTGLVIPCKALIDIVPDDKDSLVDLKTTGDANMRAWVRNVVTQGYDIQAAMYLDMFNVATKEERSTFRHIVQESDAPYEILRRELSLEFIQIGRAKYERALVDYCYCLKSSNWPSIDEMNVPGSQILHGWRIVSPEPWMIGRDDL
jgi:hypothetical protein